jgi:flagellar motor protein MotB
MKQTTIILIVFMAITGQLFGQSDFIIAKSKSIKTEYPPKPKDFKTSKLSWGELGACVNEDVQFGTWFKFYPTTPQLKVTVSCGLNWGNLADPVIFVAYLDTINGVETLVPLACKQFQGSVGDFPLEAFGLKKDRKHYLLVGATGAKQQFALYLTEHFTPTPIEQDQEETPAKKEEKTPSQHQVPTPPKPSSQINASSESVRAGVIMGRVRRQNGRPLSELSLELLNDDLEAVSQTVTDENGVFRINDVDLAKLNLVRLGDDDDKLLIDMYLYDQNGNIISKSVELGHRLHSFESAKNGFAHLNILTEKDLLVMVKQGRSTMTGKVVDRQTYLIGKERVRVGLYTPRKSLLRTAYTDHSGNFVFTQLEDQDYIVKVDHNPSDEFVEIVLTDDQHVPYAVSNSEDRADDGYFRFRKLPQDQFELMALEIEDHSGFKHHYYTMLAEEEIGVPYELHSIEFATAAVDLGGQNDELDQLARELLEEANASLRILIIGHTDNVGAELDNQKLSLLRAQTVKQYLVQKGVPAGRIECEGKGLKDPVASNKDEEGRKANRRVEFLIL